MLDGIRLAKFFIRDDFNILKTSFRSNLQNKKQHNQPHDPIFSPSRRCMCPPPPECGTAAEEERPGGGPDRGGVRRARSAPRTGTARAPAGGGQRDAVTRHPNEGRSQMASGIGKRENRTVQKSYKLKKVSNDRKKRATQKMHSPSIGCALHRAVGHIGRISPGDGRLTNHIRLKGTT